MNAASCIPIHVQVGCVAGIFTRANRREERKVILQLDALYFQGTAHDLLEILQLKSMRMACMQTIMKNSRVLNTSTICFP